MKTTILISRALGIVVWILLTTPGVAAEEFVGDFSQGIDKRFIQYVGPHASLAIEQTNRGLVITLPTDEPGRAQVGISSQFSIIGDFEITMEYQFVDVETPKKGYGAGVQLRLFTTEGPVHRINFTHFKSSNGENVFAATLLISEEGEKKRHYEGFPAETDSGRLRLTRKGSTLSFLVAESGSKEFRELHQAELGTAPLSSTQVLADTGGSDQPITVLIEKLAIRADQLSIGPPVPQANSIWSIWLLVGTMGVLVVIGAGFQYWRQSRS